MPAGGGLARHVLVQDCVDVVGTRTLHPEGPRDHLSVLLQVLQELKQVPLERLPHGELDIRGENPREVVLVGPGVQRSHCLEVLLFALAGADHERVHGVVHGDVCHSKRLFSLRLGGDAVKQPQEAWDVVERQVVDLVDHHQRHLLEGEFLDDLWVVPQDQPAVLVDADTERPHAGGLDSAQRVDDHGEEAVALPTACDRVGENLLQTRVHWCYTADQFRRSLISRSLLLYIEFRMCGSEMCSTPISAYFSGVLYLSGSGSQRSATPSSPSVALSSRARYSCTTHITHPIPKPLGCLLSRRLPVLCMCSTPLPTRTSHSRLRHSRVTFTPCVSRCALQTRYSACVTSAGLNHLLSLRYRKAMFPNTIPLYFHLRRHMRDQNTDPTFAGLKAIVDERPALSEMVKTAAVGEDERKALPLTAFADPHNRMYPVHTPAQALLSRAYLEKEASVDPAVMGRVNAALDLYGVGLPGLTRVKQAAVEDEPVYLLPGTKQFEFSKTASVKDASEAVLRHSKKLSPSSLASAATTLVKEAAARGQGVPLDILAQAGLVQCDLEKAAEWIEARGAACPKAATVYSKLAQGVRTLPSTTERADLVKVAGVIGKLDKEFGLAKHYGKKLPNPQSTVFNTKRAMEQTISLAGTDVPLSTLMAKGIGFYQDALGPDVAQEISKDGALDEQGMLEILPTLPRDMQQILVKNLG